MAYEIGQEIRKKIEEKGMTFVAFSERFGISDRNLQHFFKKTDISLQQITNASEILDYDFVTDYLNSLKEKGKGKWMAAEPVLEYKKIAKYITVSLNVTGELKTYTENFPDLLKAVNESATKLGFRIE